MTIRKDRKTIQGKLDSPIATYEFSVRALHCFRQANINTLRELVSKTDEELLGIRNFGKRTLVETKRLLSRFGLELGHQLAMPTKSKNMAVYDIPYEKLLIPVKMLNLSRRSSNCLREANIQIVADLVKRSEDELMGYKNFGKKSLSEIKLVLSPIGLRLGMAFDVDELRRVALTNIQEGKDKVRVQAGSLSTCLTYIRKNILDADSLKGQLANKRLFYVVQMRFLSGKKKTLEDIGKEISLTRERVRQIEKKAVEALFRALSFPCKQFIYQFINEIKEEGGIKCCKNEDCEVKSLEFKLFNVILTRFGNVEFDDKAKVWLFLKKKSDIFKKINKFLTRRCELKHFYREQDIRKFVEECLPCLRVDEKAFNGLMSIVVAHWFQKSGEQFAFKSISGVEVLSQLIKENFPKGIALYKEADSLMEMAKSNGYLDVIKRSKRAFIAYVQNSEDLILWDWGVYIHRDNVKIDDELLSKVEDWIDNKFLSGFSPVSLWGAFLKFEKECKASNVPNEHALYSCMKLKYAKKYSFLKDPHVYRRREKERINISQTLEDIVERHDSVVTLQQLVDDSGLKGYQITQHILESNRILPCEDGKYIHENKLNITKEDLDKLSTWIIKEVKTNNHTSVKHVYEENIVSCQKCNILDSRVLYAVLSKTLDRKLNFPRYPYIVDKDHKIIVEGRFSFNDIANDYFSRCNRIVYEKELYHYFVEERGYSASAVSNICYLCENIVQYARGAYISLEVLGWDEKKNQLLGQIATEKFINCFKAGHAFVCIDDLLEEQLPAINEVIDLSWQKRLLADLLERIDKVRILGDMGSVYVIIPNENKISNTEDLVCYLLVKEFSGAANKDVFQNKLRDLKIAVSLDQNAKKYKVVNEEIMLR